MVGEEKRQCERISHEGRFEYALSVPDILEPRTIRSVGNFIDICRHGRGVGFITDYPLEPGHVICISDNGHGIRPAVVKWIERTEDKYRVGIYLFGNRREV